MYAVKVYNADTSYKKTIPPRDIVGDFSFSGNINSSMGPITITVSKSFGNNEYENGNLVRVFAIDENNKTEKLVYGGVITTITRKADETKELIDIGCLGYSQLMFFTAIDTISTNNRPPQDIVSDIIAFMNTKYPGYFYIKSIATKPNISYGLETLSSALQHLERIAEITGRSWYIGQDGGLTMGPKPTTPTHSLTFRKEISTLEVEEDGSEIVNKVIVRRSTSASTIPGPFVQSNEIVQDLASIAQYGERVKYFPGEIRAEGDPIQLIFYGPIGLASAQSFGQSQLNTTPQKTTRIKVNNKYDYYSIQPFDTIKVKNIDYSINNLQVLKVTYQKDGAVLDVEKLENFGTLGKKLLG